MTQARDAAESDRSEPLPQQYFSPTPRSPDIRRSIPVRIMDRQLKVEVSNGVFSANRLDLGTSVLLKHVPAPPQSGNLLDLGCGWGAIALALGFSSPHSQVWAVDVNERAVDLTKANAHNQGLSNIRAMTPEAVPEDVTFDLIWSNPPIRIGKEALHALLVTWLRRLNDRGKAYLVVQRNLGSDSLITWLKSAMGGSLSVSKHASAKGFRVIEVARTA